MHVELTTPNTLALRVRGCDTALKFSVQLSDDQSVIWSFTFETPSRIFRVHDMTPGNTYCVRVKAILSEEWLADYGETFRFTLPKPIDATPFLRVPKIKSTKLQSRYKELAKELSHIPGSRLTLLVQGNRREQFTDKLARTIPKYEEHLSVLSYSLTSRPNKKHVLKICSAASQNEAVGVYYPLVAINPSCDIQQLATQFNAIERGKFLTSNC